MRRVVVAFVVNRLFMWREAAEQLNDLTTYYLLHRNDFGMATPAGACILYALSCNLSDADLAVRFDLLVRGNQGDAASADEEDEPDPPTTSSSEIRLKSWHRRTAKAWAKPPPAAARRRSTASTA